MPSDTPASPAADTHLADTANQPAFSPLYLQIKQAILASLQAGEWKPLDAMPSEMDLARRYGVSQGTVRKALDALATENLVVRKQGKGTFVASHNERHVKYRFLSLHPDTGSVDSEGPAQRNILSLRRVAATATQARTLALRTGDSLLHVRRVLSFGGIPTILESMWLPEALFAQLSTTLMAQYQGPTYALFEEKFGVHTVRADEQVRAALATPAQATALRLTPPAALLRVDRVSYTYNDKPVEMRQAFYRTDTHHYRNTLN